MSEFTPPPRAINGAYVIRFDFGPEEPHLYAAKTPEGLGFAFTPETALTFNTRAGAEATLHNGYGPSQEHAEVIEL